MSAQKYSYKPTDAVENASTVILLKDGSAMEVRRGAKTTWEKDEQRQRWASLVAWMDTLPAGASITKSAAAPSSGSDSAHVPMSSEMKRVVDGLTSTVENGTKYPLCGNLWYVSPLDLIKKRNERHIHYYNARIAQNPQQASFYQPLIAKLKEQIAAASVEKVYMIPRNSTNSSVRLYCKAADGSLQRVWFNHRLGLFGLRDGKGVRAAASLAELGFPADAELWGRRRHSENIVKI